MPEPRKMTSRVPTTRVSGTSIDKFDEIVEGAVAPRPPVNLPQDQPAEPQAQMEADHEPVATKPPLPASQLKSMSQGRGRPKKNVKRPWEGLPTTPGARMTLILDPRDKARLDFLQHTYDRPAQRFLRAYIEDALRDDAEAAFAQMYPDAGPPEEDD